MKPLYFFIAFLLSALLAGCAGSRLQASLAGAGMSAPQPLQAAQTANGSVAVSGEAQINVVPDEVVLNLGVETWNDDLAAAKRQNDEIVQKVQAIARSKGIEPRDIQTDFMNIEPRYKDSYQRSDFLGYFVRRSIMVTLKDPDQFETLLSEVLEGGVNYVHGIDFRTSELRKNRDQARDLAIQAAREKARALARGLGKEIGEPLSIREEQNDWWGWYGSGWGYGSSGLMSQNVVQNAGGSAWSGEGPTAPGQISVRARVSVEFELK